MAKSFAEETRKYKLALLERAQHARDREIQAQAARVAALSTPPVASETSEHEARAPTEGVSAEQVAKVRGWHLALLPTCAVASWRLDHRITSSIASSPQAKINLPPPPRFSEDYLAYLKTSALPVAEASAEVEMYPVPMVIGKEALAEALLRLRQYLQADAKAMQNA